MLQQAEVQQPSPFAVPSAQQGGGDLPVQVGSPESPAVQPACLRACMQQPEPASAECSQQRCSGPALLHCPVLSRAAANAGTLTPYSGQSQRTQLAFLTLHWKPVEGQQLRWQQPQPWPSLLLLSAQVRAAEALALAAPPLSAAHL